MDTRSVVVSLYASLLGREPSGGEELTKAEYLDSGGTVAHVVERILTSPECQISFYGVPAFREIVAPEPLPPDTPRLYFWHLPKTGGTSLNWMLQPHFDQLEMCLYLPLGDLYRMSNYRLRSFRLISGHFGPTLPQLLFDVTLVTVTLVRDPVETVASHYVHWRDRRPPTHPLTDLARHLTFDEWCHREDLFGLWSNPQATSLATPRLPPTREEVEISPDGTLGFLAHDQLPERAMSLLDEIDIVGTPDDLVSVYRSALARLGREPTLEVPLRANVGTGWDRAFCRPLALGFWSTIRSTSPCSNGRRCGARNS